ncbi:MAG: enoyl-CoA hydratase/isomerase family protein [Anaerofustis sp.]
MDYQDILYEVRDNIAFITINRPKVLNALRMNTKHELEHAIDAIEKDDSILGVILTGCGRAFIAGSDISEINVDAKGEETVAMSSEAHLLFNKFEALGKPIIAAVNGYAMGGGTELALACDIRIASSKAVFGLPEVDLGVAPCYGGTQRLPRLVGTGIAKEILFTARKVYAEEAKSIGLVNKVVEHAELMNEAEAMMKQIIKNAPQAVKYCKYMVNKGIEMSLIDGLKYEAEVAGILVETEDAKEGVKAFFEKRPPVFQNK